MRLQTRLSIATASIISLVSVAIGGFAVTTSFDSDVARVDDSLASAARIVTHSNGDAISSALLAADQSSMSLTVDFLSINGDLVHLTPGSVDISSAPSLETLKAANNNAISLTSVSRMASHGKWVSDADSYRLRTVALPDNEFLLFAISLSAQIQSRDANIRLLIWFVLGSVLFGAIAITFFIRRDVRKISKLVDAAGDIAAGHDDVVLPAGQGQSEVDRLARALRHMVDSLQHSVEVERDAQLNMQRFLGDASHELRTPLTVIKGYVELLQKNPGAGVEQSTRAYDRMLSEANRMDDLIRDLLLLAELGEAKTETRIMNELSVIDFSGLVNVAIDDLRILQPNRPIVVAVEPGIVVLGARDLLMQVLANLTSNIRRHTAEGDSLRVSLRSEVAALAEGEPAHHNDEFAVLTFDDGGKGLPEEFYTGGIGHFQRFDNSRSRESGGSGLGMSILAAIVRRHGGTVKLEKSDLGGLRTQIRLPIAK